MLIRSRVKYIQTLGQKQFRQEEGLFIAEGPKIVRELIESSPEQVVQVLALESWLTENASLVGKIDATEISQFELEKISQLSTPNQVLAVVQQFGSGQPGALNDSITLVLDDIQDPGNFGSIIRIADWFGIAQVVCSLHSADLYNPKVVQSTMGSIARVRVFYTDLELWLPLQKTIPIYATVLNGRDIRNFKKLKEGILLIGNESKGIHPSLLPYAKERLTISGNGGAVSLNAAVATGIVLSHLVELNEE